MVKWPCLCIRMRFVHSFEARLLARSLARAHTHTTSNGLCKWIFDRDFSLNAAAAAVAVAIPLIFEVSSSSRTWNAEANKTKMQANRIGISPLDRLERLDSGTDRFSDAQWFYFCSVEQWVYLVCLWQANWCSAAVERSAAATIRNKRICAAFSWVQCSVPGDSAHGKWNYVNVNGKTKPFRI